MIRITPTRFAVSLLLVAAIIGTSAATSAVHRASDTPPAAQVMPRAHLMAYGGRSAAQQRSGVGGKFDAALADLARHSNRARAGSAGLMDLRSLNPAAHFIVARDTGVQYVAVDAVTRGDVRQLKAALTSLGMQRPKTYLNDVGGWLPLSALNAAAALPQLHSIRASMSRAHAGAVTTQGDYVQGSAAARTNSGADGTGVTVGILSDSYDCYKLYADPTSGVTTPAAGNNGYAPNGFTATAENDIASGDLPAAANINILEEASTSTDASGTTCGYSAYFLPDGDEGRAMMQIVHDVAPGAKLAFHTAAITEADFATGIHDLATAGAKVIADDVSYFDEPFFQDGLIAQAVNAVNAAGVAYFSAAGNSGSNGYDNTAPVFATASTTPANEMLLNFDTTAATTTTGLTVNLPQLEPGQFIAVILEWDQPFVTGAASSGGATSQMDLCITGSDTGLISAPQNPNDPNGGAITTLDNTTQACTGANNLTTDPYQILIVGFPANAADTGIACPSGSTASFCSAAQSISVQVGLAGGATPNRIKVAIDDNGAGVTYPSGGITPTGGTLQGHPSATGAMAVGAAFWYDTTVCGAATTVLESYSARGGDPILFDVTGMRLATAEMRQKPDIVGPDGGNDTFLGFQIGAGGGPGQCANIASFPNFFGTSAAAPHVAAAAALMLQKNPALTPAQIYNTLRSTTSPMTGTSSAPDDLSGYGFIKADTALADTAAVTVMLGLNPATINVGQSATLTWSSTNTSSCTASGSWPSNGSINPSGTMMVSPAAAGSYVYTLTCTNPDSSAMESQTLTVVMPSSGGGGGGGALDLAALLALSGAALARVRRGRRTPQA
jgi:subtilisin family serine protease